MRRILKIVPNAPLAIQTLTNALARHFYQSSHYITPLLDLTGVLLSTEMRDEYLFQCNQTSQPFYKQIKY